MNLLRHVNLSGCAQLIMFILCSIAAVTFLKISEASEHMSGTGKLARTNTVMLVITSCCFGSHEFDILLAGVFAVLLFCWIAVQRLIMSRAG